MVDGYLSFEGVLQYSLNAIRASQIWYPWPPYLFLFQPDRAFVGLGGFKSVPEANCAVEIGYSVAPNYPSRGVATSAARQLIEIALASKLVDCVSAHTLAERNDSTRVIEKCGMSKVSERFDPEDGPLWRWEISTV